VIAEGDEVGWREAEKLCHHVASDSQFAVVRAAEDARQTLSKAVVATVSRDRGRELGVAVFGDDAVDNGLEGRVGSAEGGEVPKHSVKDVGAHGKDLVQGVVCL
jgi:hypothetical protein